MIKRFISWVLPHFIVRHYIFQDVQKITHYYSFRGSVLDVGCGEQPYRKLFSHAQYTGIDFPHYSPNPSFAGQPPDMFFNKKYRKTWRLPFKNDTFQNTVSFEVLEHHPYPARLLNEMARVTKPRGYILIAAPFIWSLHEQPHDYFRPTEYSLRKLLTDANCRILAIYKQGSICSTVTTLFTDALIEFAQKNKLTYIISLLLYPFVLILTYVSFLLDKVWKTQTIFLNYVVLAQKKK